jgi:hypothetical protein
MWGRIALKSRFTYLFSIRKGMAISHFIYSEFGDVRKWGRELRGLTNLGEDGKGTYN